MQYFYWRSQKLVKWNNIGFWHLVLKIQPFVGAVPPLRHTWHVINYDGNYVMSSVLQACNSSGRNFAQYIKFYEINT